MEYISEFPCGFKRVTRLNVLDILFGCEFDSGDGLCPMHRKKCSKWIK